MPSVAAQKHFGDGENCVLAAGGEIEKLSKPEIIPYHSTGGYEGDGGSGTQKSTCGLLSGMVYTGSTN